MSFAIMNRVWQASRAKGTDRLVLVALADYANEEGVAFPANATLARKVNTSERNCQYSVGALVALGELVVERNAGPKGCNNYRIILGTTVQPVAPQQAAAPVQPVAPPELVEGVQPASRGGAAGFARGVQPIAHEPSLNHQEPPKRRGATSPITLLAYLNQCNTDGRDPIPEGSGVFRLAAQKGIPSEYVELAWLEFKRHHLPDGTFATKKQKDWAATFRNAVDQVWDKLWWVRPDDNKFELTSRGREATNLHANRAAA